jgi:Collagen triple helix repeat (20 copies)
MTRGFGRFLRQNTIALLALFLVLGGTSFAAATLINGSQIKKHSIAKNRLTNKAIKQLKGNRGPQGPQGAAGAAGAQGARGPTGAQGAPGAAGSAVAYGRVASDGTLDATNSKNVTSSHFGTGFYCLTPSATVHNGVATIGFGADVNSDIYIDLNGFCGAGKVAVATYNGSGAAANEPFMFTLN